MSDRQSADPDEHSLENDNELKFYTTDQVAELFGVTPETVRNWINTGKLPAMRLSMQFRIRRGDLIAFAKEKYPT